MDKYSADALRYWAAGTKLGDDMPFQEKDVQTAQYLINKLWNASRFVLRHLEDYDGEKPSEFKRAEDRWLLSKLHDVITKVTDFFEKYEFAKARKEAELFFWHVFCDNYLEMVKQRLYNRAEYSEEEVKAAQYCLYHGLLSVLKIFAPIMPYITEEIYSYYFMQREDTKSIHASSWPQAESWWRDEETEKNGDLAVEIISAIRQYKNKNRMPLNAELEELQLPEKIKSRLAHFEAAIKDTMKIKNISYKKEIQNPNAVVVFEDREINMLVG
jgi:valyl-tRNA synthetase